MLGWGYNIVVTLIALKMDLLRQNSTRCFDVIKQLKDQLIFAVFNIVLYVTDIGTDVNQSVDYFM